MRQPSPGKPSRLKRSRRGGIFVGLLVCVVLAGLTGWLGYSIWYGGEKSITPEDLIVEKVTRGPFDQVVLEQGEIESSANTEIVCEVEMRGSSGTPIVWAIDEGEGVEKGDKLVELDSSQLEIELKEDRLEVAAAESNVITAEAALEQAKIAKQEYIEGMYETEKITLESQLAVAEQDMRKAQLKLESSLRLASKGLIKDLQVQADRFALVNAQNQKASIEQQLEVLKNLTLQKFLVQYDSDIEAAQATLEAMRSELYEEQQEMEDRQRQIEKCVMYAPTDGVVVHANEYSRRGGNAEFVVEPGALVREQQPIIRLPNPEKMQVKCKVNESQVTLIEVGMPARIQIDALPGLKLRGRVTKVNRYAEPGGWMSSAVKEYATLVKIVDPPDSIRTGMTAATQIFVQRLPDALQVPLQAVYEHGGEMYSLVQTGPESFETRGVTIGSTNEAMAHIEAGLVEGEKVVLNCRQHLQLMDLPEVELDDNSDLDELGQDRSDGQGRGSARGGAESGGSESGKDRDKRKRGSDAPPAGRSTDRGDASEGGSGGEKVSSNRTAGQNASADTASRDETAVGDDPASDDDSTAESDVASRGNSASEVGSEAGDSAVGGGTPRGEAGDAAGKDGVRS